LPGCTISAVMDVATNYLMKKKIMCIPR